MPRKAKHLRFFHHEKWNARASFVAPLLVAAVVVAGLLVLSAAHLRGNLAAQRSITDHSAAIQRLFFRE